MGEVRTILPPDRKHQGRRPNRVARASKKSTHGSPLEMVITGWRKKGAHRGPATVSRPPTATISGASSGMMNTGTSGMSSTRATPRGSSSGARSQRKVTSPSTVLHRPTTQK
jgi:hypothetical protein